MIVDLDYERILEAVDELAKYSPFGIGGRGMTTLSLMKYKKVRRIMTHDTAFKRIG